MKRAAFSDLAAKEAVAPTSISFWPEPPHSETSRFLEAFSTLDIGRAMAENALDD